MTFTTGNTIASSHHDTHWHRRLLLVEVLKDVENHPGALNEQNKASTNHDACVAIGSPGEMLF